MAWSENSMLSLKRSNKLIESDGQTHKSYQYLLITFATAF